MLGPAARSIEVSSNSLGSSEQELAPHFGLGSEMLMVTKSDISRIQAQYLIPSIFDLEVLDRDSRVDHAPD